MSRHADNAAATWTLACETLEELRRRSHEPYARAVNYGWEISCLRCGGRAEAVAPYCRGNDIPVLHGVEDALIKACVP